MINLGNDLMKIMSMVRDETKSWYLWLNSDIISIIIEAMWLKIGLFNEARNDNSY